MYHYLVTTAHNKQADRQSSEKNLIKVKIGKGHQKALLIMMCYDRVDVGTSARKCTRTFPKPDHDRTVCAEIRRVYIVMVTLRRAYDVMITTSLK